MLKSLAPTLGLFAFVLIPAAAHSQGIGANDPDRKEVVAYRLTVPALNKVTQAAKNLAEATRTDPRFVKLAALKAEIEKLQEKDELTDAEVSRLDKLRAEAEQAEEKLNVAANANTLSDMAAAIEKEPLARNALADAGISAREFATFALASFQAGMVATMMKQGLVKEVPKELAATVNMDNVKFFQEHEAEFEALTKAMKAIQTRQTQPVSSHAEPLGTS
jgi:hypothetical protein